MEKLTLEHLAPYLPYGLNVLDRMDFDSREYNIEYVKNDNSYVLSIGTFSATLSKPYRYPILRPMSELCKEIKINGQKFIPIVNLYNLSKGQIENKELLDFEFIDSWAAGKILKAYNYNRSEYTEFIYHDFNFRKETHMQKGLFRFGIDLPHPIKVNSTLENQYKLHRFMFKYHFDVFGLIEKGLAISIHDVKKT